MTDKSTTVYNETSMRQQGDMEHVRCHPGMYLGSCQNPWNALKEVLDNAVDESIAGFVHTIYIRYDRKTKELFVADDGRGIPVGKHPQLGISTLIAAFTKQRFGGKFNRVNGAYNTSVGTHGIGTKATNALSTEFEVWTNQKGKWYHVLFKEGVPTKKIPESVLKPSFHETPFDSIGTQVRVRPSKEYFETLDIDVDSLEERCSDIAYLCPGLKVILEVGKRKTFQSEKGLTDLVEGLIRVEAQTLAIKKLHPEPFHLTKVESDGTGIECALQWTNGDEEEIFSYVNVSDTPEHGLHYTGLIDAISNVLSAFTKKSHDYDPEDLLVGLYGVVHLRHKDPQFKSQTKDRLVKPQGVRNEVYTYLLEPLKAFFRRNKGLADSLVEKACQLKKARTSYKDKKRALKGLELRRGARGILPGKLLSATKCKPWERELYICEGDSAGGSAGSGRDSRFQEVLPLRGKIINSMRKEDAAVLGNVEVQSIIQAIGTDIRDKCDPDKARVGKVLLMADADSDGAHITSLLISLFIELWKPLVEKGMVYVVDSPLYKATVGNHHVYGDSLRSVKKKLGKKLAKRANISRFKGLGESSPEEIAEYGMNKSTRRLFKLVLRGPKDVLLLREIMGENTERRKQIMFGTG
jgi:DNA gyrase subunit B